MNKCDRYSSLYFSFVTVLDQHCRSIYKSLFVVPWRLISLSRPLPRNQMPVGLETWTPNQDENRRADQGCHYQIIPFVSPFTPYLLLLLLFFRLQITNQDFCFSDTVQFSFLGAINIGCWSDISGISKIYPATFFVLKV